MFGNFLNNDNLWVIIIAVIIIALLVSDKKDPCDPCHPDPCHDPCR